MILDVPYIQRNISYNPKLWHTFNVKPIGYDLNYSVYWYFGTTKLYREDFSDAINLSANSSMLHVSILYLLILYYLFFNLYINIYCQFFFLLGHNSVQFIK